MQRPASVPPRYLYDALGSRLFAAITELPEYYPTRTEASLLSRHGEQIARVLAPVRTLVDLGAGDCKKAARLLPLLQPQTYIAVDVSQACVAEGTQAIARDFPGIDVAACITDFASGMQWPEGLRCERPVFFYPGSSIGNFSPDQAGALLGSLSAVARQEQNDHARLLIGVDRVQSVPVMEAAYADALGLTACFNLNLLRHVNQALDADFDVKRFTHRAVFDKTHSRIEMSLVSKHSQVARWPGGERHFDEGEPIITEHSYKYTIADFEGLLHASGFETLQRWTDDHESYLLCAARSVC